MTADLSRRGLPWPLLLAGALMLGYLVAPLLALAGALPRAQASDLTSAAGPLATSLVAATLATLLDGLLGIPLGLWLARTRSRWRHAVTAGVLVPLALPPVISGLVLVLLLGPGGWPGSLLDAGGLDPLNTLSGTVLAQMFVAAPFVVISARTAFAGIDPGLEDAARSLGLGPGATLLRVLVPAARRGLATGLALGWLRCLGEFGATAIVAYHPYTLPVLVYIRLTGEGLRPALPPAAVLACLGGAAAAFLLWLDRRPPGRRLAADSEPGDSWEVGLAPASPALARWPIAVSATLRAGSLDLDIGFRSQSQVVALLGRSGAGKTLTLRVAAGLIKPDRGRVEIAGRVLLDTAAGVDLPPERRRLGYVAQHEALFDHLDAEGNLAFAMDKAQRPLRVDDLVRSLGLDRVRHSRIETLSGGERQRVALGRALAAEPLALLLDEPFSALDAPVRRELRRLVRRIHATTGIPILLVTHDREDVLDLADEVVVIEAGQVVQADSVEAVFARPSSRSVAQLVGISNVVPVLAARLESGAVLVRTIWGEWELPPADGLLGGRAELAVPVAAVRVRAGAGKFKVRSSRPHPLGRLLEVDLPGEAGIPSLEGIAGARHPLPGQSCQLQVDGSLCHLMPATPVVSPEPKAALRASGRS